MTSVGVEARMRSQDRSTVRRPNLSPEVDWVAYLWETYSLDELDHLRLCPE